MNRSLSGGMKIAASQLIENGQFCDLRFGTVVKTSPLQVKITNLLTLPQSVLIVPEHLTNHKVNVVIDWTTTTDSHKHVVKDSTNKECTVEQDTHSHKVNGTKTMTINNALKVGDKVALIRKTGGQYYYILDRI